MSSCLGFSSGLSFLVFDNPATVFDKSKVPETPKSFLFTRPFEIGNSETKLSFSGGGLWWIDLKWLMIHQDVAIASQIFLFSRAFISMILTIDNQYVYERQTWSSNWSCKMRWLWVIGTAQSKVMTKSYFCPNQQFFFSLKLGSLSTLKMAIYCPKGSGTHR